MATRWDGNDWVFFRAELKIGVAKAQYIICNLL